MAQKSSSVYVQTTPEDWVDPVTASTRRVRGLFAERFVGRICTLIFGLVLLIIGVPMLVLPGPGLLVIGAGVTCIALAMNATPRSGRTKS